MLSVEEQNERYVLQIKKLVQVFSSIESDEIRQYSLNLMTAISKMNDDVPIKNYLKDLGANPQFFK